MYVLHKEIPFDLTSIKDTQHQIFLNQNVNSPDKLTNFVNPKGHVDVKILNEKLVNKGVDYHAIAN